MESKLTFRQYLIGQALAGYASQASGRTPKQVAQDVINLADGVLIELAKEPTPPDK
jgi:hypothetical protein